MPTNIIITPGDGEISFQDGSNPVRKLIISGSNLSYESTISASNFYTHNNSGTFYGSASYAATASYAVSYYSGSAVSASYALTASYASNAGSFLTTGSTYPITASRSISSSYVVNADNSTSSSFASTASYVANSISSSYSLTASYALNASEGGTTLITGSTYPITASWSNNAITASYATAPVYNNIITASLQTGSIVNQTILYSVGPDQENIITGLNLEGDAWGVSVLERWIYATGDPYYTSCSLLLHFNGANNSTTFADSGPNNVSVTRSGNTKITSSIYKFGSGSGYFDGTGDYLSFSSVPTVFAGSNFTIEFWANFSDVGVYRPILSRRADCNAYTTLTLDIGRQADNKINATFVVGSTLTSVTSTTTISQNTWYNVVVTRDNNTVYLFINGVLESSAGITGIINNQGGTTYIGSRPTCSPTTAMFGYLDEFRITKGVARYTSSFTPQSIEFPNSIYTQYDTTYVALVGGLNDTGSDYGVQKLDNTSLKIRKMAATGQPVSGSQFLGQIVDRVYVNVLDYTNVMVSSSYSEIIQYIQSSSHADVATFATSSISSSFASASVSSSYALAASSALTASYALNGGGGGGSTTAIYRYGTTSVVNPGGYAATIIKYNIAVTDSTSWYNNTTGRFTPTVAGWYQVSAGARVYSGGGEGYLTLRKNGADLTSVGGTGVVNTNLSLLVYFNGSTDYVQIYSITGNSVTNAQSSTITPFTMAYITS